MQFNLKFKFIIFNIFVYSFIFSESNYNFIDSKFKKYKRPVTVLEITDDSIDYTLNFASKYNGVFVILYLGKNSKSILRKIKDSYLYNIVLLEPKNIKPKDIDILSRCEHFDISIVHDFYNNFDSDELVNVFNYFLKLGDNIFFEVFNYYVKELMYTNDKLKKLNKNNKKELFLFKTKKTKLELARFTQLPRSSHSSQNYEVYSDYEKKLFNKKLLENPVKWIPGINLVTFVMLRGIYPSNKFIYESIKGMRDNIPYHNDLMIGNMIIQGYKIAAIDFKDKRRNANMKKCIDRALKVFESNSRLRNPAKCMDRYYNKKN